MTLDILVNHYQENESIVERFLSSLAMQKAPIFFVSSHLKLRTSTFPTPVCATRGTS